MFDHATLLASLFVSFFLSSCTGMCPSEVISLDDEFAEDAEVDRLRFFREIDTDVALKDKALTGRDIRVTIMGEMVDARHPDLQSRVIRQYNMFSAKNQIKTGYDPVQHGVGLLNVDAAINAM